MYYIDFFIATLHCMYFIVSITKSYIEIGRTLWQLQIESTKSELSRKIRINTLCSQSVIKELTSYGS